MNSIPANVLRLAAVVALLAACDDDMDHDADMRRDIDTVEEHASMLSQEIEQHAAALAGVSDIAATRTVEAAHEARMSEHMRAMDHAVLDMKQYCHRTSQRAQESTQDMDRAMAGMHDEDERHRSSIGAAFNVAAAQNEEQRHRAATGDRIAALRLALEVMRPDIGWWRCNPMNHGA